MGFVNIDLYAFAPNYESDINELIKSLSFNLSISNQEKVYIVFVTPDMPEWFVHSMDLPEWGKSIFTSLLKVAQSVSLGSQACTPRLSDLLKIVDFGPEDWLAQDLKTFFYYRDDKLICFVLLLDVETNREILLNRISGYIYFLSTYWYATNKGLLLHGAAIANNRKGYLFLGEGGAGKSTAAYLSTSVGASVLSDDLAFVVIRENGIYELAAAPGQGSRYTTNPLLRPQLKRIFRLIKDTSDNVIPLSRIATAHIIYRSFEWSHWVDHLSEKALSLAYQSACSIARTIPGYELHFRKSPDFWKLIDAEFPD